MKTSLIVRLYQALALISLVLLSCTNDVAPPEAVTPVPIPRQLEWHRMEMNAFIHFTTNTFTDKEWGYGDESPSVFNPSGLDTRQWVNTLKDAGFKGLILTCKHHDGFCLWPSEFTDHSVKSSPWQDGNGNVVQEVHDACREAGLKFGVYLSPWDRNRLDYGTDSYIEYYRNQLKELFNLYSPVFEMWFDGANGGNGYYGGANETRRIEGRSYYDWPGTLEMIRSMEPEVIFFSDAGPDIRWCGNERGYVGETNWNTISTDTLYAGKPRINALLNSGSEEGTNWVPAEVDVSIRPGWFYHASQDSLVKSPEELFDIYLSSVGRGSNLLLNVPPDRRGLLHERDVEVLREWRKMLDEAFTEDFAAGMQVTADSYRGKSDRFKPSNVTDGDPDTYWATDDGIIHSNLEIDFNRAVTVNYILIQEYIQLGQRVKSFSIDTWQDGTWVLAAEGTTIGYKRILRVPAAETSRIRINIADSKACPVISNIEVY